MHTKDSRSFLLLQGVASPFFYQLETALIEANQSCLKVNFCGGDLLSGPFFSKPKNHINYQGSLDDLATFYSRLFDQHKITDIALFGDTRPIHLDAIRLAKQRNIHIHVFEEGYFRPNWVTLDNGGVNANSKVFQASKNRAIWFLKKDNANGSDYDYDKHIQKTGGSILVRAWHDIRFHLASFILKRKFPHYKNHRPDSPFAEYCGFLCRMPLVNLYYNRRCDQDIEKLLGSQSPYYLLPLQLQADSQIRKHSPFESISEVIETTLKSFAKNAPKNAKLVIKLHPLDPWFINYKKIIKQQITVLRLDKKRVIYLEAGNLGNLLDNCQGTVLVNSTVGTSALGANCPVIALGSAIFDIDGLTFQGSLDDFWLQKKPPNKGLFNAFRQYYIKQTQINGSFYNQQGIALAVAGSVDKLL